MVVVADLRSLKSSLRLPVIAAPMFLVSGPDLVIAACRAGIVGSFPANNARSIDVLDEWMARIVVGLAGAQSPWAVNIVVHRTYERTAEEMELVLKYKPPIVIAALGSPAAIVDAVHGYGGQVLADVSTLHYARKAAAAGVDGLILLTAGAGGHTGHLSAFAFVPAVRAFFDGTIVLAGAIGTGRAIRAAEVLGADLVYMGTRLIASEESAAAPAYKQMLIDSSADDIVQSAAVSGMPANWLRASLVAAGYDTEKTAPQGDVEFGRPETTAAKRWRDVWSAGQGADAVASVEKVAEIVSRLELEYADPATDAALPEGILPAKWSREAR